MEVRWERVLEPGSRAAECSTPHGADMGAVGWMEEEDLREQAGDMKRIWQVRRVGAADGHTCMNENGVIYSELNQELLKDAVDVVGGGGW